MLTGITWLVLGICIYYWIESLNTSHFCWETTTADGWDYTLSRSRGTLRWTGKLGHELLPRDIDYREVRFSVIAGGLAIPALLSGLWCWRCVGEYRRRRRAVSEGRCVNCGYDLRASHGRCPECGCRIPQPIRPPAAAPRVRIHGRGRRDKSGA